MFVLQVYKSKDYNADLLYCNCQLMALNQDEVNFVYCPIQGNKIEGGVLNRVGILRFSFVLNRVRVSNPQRLSYTQILVE